MTNSDICREAFEEWNKSVEDEEISLTDGMDLTPFFYEIFQAGWKAGRENIEEKLDEYESMQPVTYMIFNKNANEVLGYRDSKEGALRALLFYRHTGCYKAIPLYRHPNK
ncbi:hypothetical protein ID850_19390 [Xenorhabdus sp. Flor]|uniref:hypothetical protein n=1 Tax=Xenorhabdus cabanillasii TaxID=351673 RepID=UPI0019B82245|nr:hypothetical protein [Xenorhabdus sp. Flor]MBD2816833.1 hypothetical protein [Xenorhabdus sp. Flor]